MARRTTKNIMPLLPIVGGNA